MLEVVDVLALRLPADGPGVADDVGDCELVTGEKASVASTSTISGKIVSACA
jgi:hypothetical protein